MEGKKREREKEGLVRMYVCMFIHIYHCSHDEKKRKNRERKEK